MHIVRHPIGSIQTMMSTVYSRQSIMSHLNTVQAMMEAMEEMDVTSPVSRSVTCENSIFVCLFVCCFLYMDVFVFPIMTQMLLVVI